MSIKPLWVVFVLLSIVCGDAAIAQTTRLFRNSRRSILDAEIGNQQVQRQSEVTRLEKMLRQFDERVVRLERQLMSMSRLPAITIAEAKAGVEFAELQLQKSKQLLEQGEEVDELQLAADRLTLARAKGQLDSAKAAHEESLIQLELDVLFAERHLLEQTNETAMLERLVAKGYASSTGLAVRKLDVGLAKKQVQRARVRLEARKNSAEAETSEEVELVEIEAKEIDPPAESP